MKTYINENIGKHFCIRLTSEDAQVAIPMMIATVMMLLTVLVFGA